MDIKPAEITDILKREIKEYDREVDVARCYELGANSFIRKHFDPRSPGQYIAEAARYWLEVNRPPPARSHA